MWDSLYPPSPREVEPPLPGRTSPMTPGQRARIVLLYAACFVPVAWPGVLLLAAVEFAFAMNTFWSWQTLLTAGALLAFLGSTRAYSACWNRRPEDIRPVSRTDQPALWAFVERVATDQSARLPDGLIVNASAECRWFDFWTPLGGLRSRLVIGHWMLELFSLLELKAILAIRLASIRGNAGEQRRCRLTRGLALRVAGEDRWNVDDNFSGALVRVAWFLSSWPMILLQRLSLWIECRNSDPFEPDAIACRLAGTDATMLAMIRADHVRQALKSVEQLILETAEAGLWTENIFALAPDAFRLRLDEKVREQWESLRPPRTPALGRDREWFELGEPYRSGFWAGFPEGDRREEHARQNYLWNEPETRPATLLTENLPAVRRELSERLYHRMGHALAARHPASNSLIKRWLDRETRHPFPPSTGNLYDSGRLIDPGDLNDPPASSESDPTDLWRSLPSVYQEAGRIAVRWNDIVRRMNDIEARPDWSHRDEIQHEALTKARRDVKQELAGIDRRLHLIHFQLAAKTSEPSHAAGLREQTRIVVEFQSIVARARRWDRELRDDCERITESSRPDGRFVKELHDINLDALDGLEELLTWAPRVDSERMRELLEGMPTNRFLCSLKRLPAGSHGSIARRIEDTWLLWREVRRKADWLHQMLLADLLRTHEEIAREFAERSLAPIVAE